MGFLYSEKCTYLPNIMLKQKNKFCEWDSLRYSEKCTYLGNFMLKKFSEQSFCGNVKKCAHLPNFMFKQKKTSLLNGLLVVLWKMYLPTNFHVKTKKV